MVSISAAPAVRAHVDARAPKKGRRGGFPAEYKLLSPDGKRKWLNENAAAYVAGRHLQHSQIEAERRALRKRSAEVSRLVPSPNRLAEHEEGYSFPPPADDPASRMRGADYVLCEAEVPVLWPAIYLTQDGATYDVVCQWNESLQRSLGMNAGDSVNVEGGASTTSSPTTAALDALANRQAEFSQGRESELKLDPEDDESLRQEIAYVTALGGSPVRTDLHF